MKVTLLITLVTFHARGETIQEEYDYDTDMSSIKNKQGGQRLVGARIAKHKEMSFVVAWTSMSTKGENLASCTGSLITNRWMISAAHCDTMVSKSQEKECLELSKKGEKYKTSLKTSVTCERDQFGGLKMKDFDPPAKAWIGANDMNKITADDVFDVEISQTIHHTHSYIPGGSYGRYGGYDITLAQFVRPVPEKFGTHACLPTPSFKDHGIDAILAGYGRYIRPACQTDEYGPYKFHYCKELVEQASYKGSTICEQGPAPRSQLCKQFFDKSNRSSVPENFEEIGIVSYRGLNFCYNQQSPNPTSKGWCEVDGDYYGEKPGRTNEDGWGFCSKDCYLSKSVATSNILRTTKAHILDEKICEHYLRQAAPNVKVKPQVLCVGDFNKWRTKYFLVKGMDISEMGESDAAKYKHFGQKMDNFGVTDGYVFSKGTCNGDSGGPVYIMNEGKPLVLGSVSGGRGSMGRCGGINNPVHYVRLSRMAVWIVKVLGKGEASNLCWNRKIKRKDSSSETGGNSLKEDVTPEGKKGEDNSNTKDTDNYTPESNTEKASSTVNEEEVTSIESRTGEDTNKKEEEAVVTPESEIGEESSTTKDEEHAATESYKEGHSPEKEEENTTTESKKEEDTNTIKEDTSTDSGTGEDISPKREDEGVTTESNTGEDNSAIKEEEKIPTESSTGEDNSSIQEEEDITESETGEDYSVTKEKEDTSTLSSFIEMYSTVKEEEYVTPETNTEEDYGAKKGEQDILTEGRIDNRTEKEQEYEESKKEEEGRTIKVDEDNEEI